MWPQSCSEFPAPCLPVFQLGFYKGPAGSQVTLSSLGNQTRLLLEEKARHLLTEQECATMAYYLEEYRGGSISVEALAMALFELLNTHAKVTGAPRPARQRLPRALPPPCLLLSPTPFLRTGKEIRWNGPGERLVTEVAPLVPGKAAHRLLGK